MSQKPSEILSKAADLLEPRGAWCQHQYRFKNNEGEVCSRCLYGAIYDASESSLEDRQLRTVDIYLTPFLPKCHRTDMAHWNDMPSRRKRQVIAVLRHGSAFALELGD